MWKYGSLCPDPFARLIEAAAVVTFTYTAFLWATGYGFILFGDFLDQWTIFGSAIIVTSRLYVFFREEKRKRS